MILVSSMAEVEPEGIDTGQEQCLEHLGRGACRPDGGDDLGSTVTAHHSFGRITAASLLGASAGAFRASVDRLSGDQDCADIVDIGERRPGSDQVADAIEIACSCHGRRGVRGHRGPSRVHATACPASRSPPRHLPFHRCRAVAGDGPDAGLAAAASAKPSRNPVLRPPRPAGPWPMVTVVSPPDRRMAGALTGSPCERTERAMPAMTVPTSRLSPSRHHRGSVMSLRPDPLHPLPPRGPGTVQR